MRRKEKRKIRVENKVNEVINAYRNNEINTDPFGQYTGITETTKEIIENASPGGKVYMNAQSIRCDMETPVQDADDL